MVKPTILDFIVVFQLQMTCRLAFGFVGLQYFEPKLHYKSNEAVNVPCPSIAIRILVKIYVASKVKNIK